MKKITVFLWCSVFLCSIMTHAQSSEIPTHLVIENSYQSTISIPLNVNPKMTFDLTISEINITTSDIQYHIYLDYDTKISYDNIATIEETNSTNSKIELQPDLLCFSTCKLNTHISIVDIKGNIIMSQVIDSGNYYYPLSELLPGIYIAKINNTTIKFIKQ